MNVAKRSQDELQLELWCVNKQLQRLQAAKINEIPVVSLIIPTEEIDEICQMLWKEAIDAENTISNIDTKSK